MGGKGSGKWARPVLPCGTQAAYQRHRRRKENCEQCKKAHKEYKKATYKRKTNRVPYGTAKKGRIVIVEEKLRRGSCMDCGLQVTRENYVCFDFDHRDPAKKSFAVSTKAGDVSESTLHAEFAKCDLVCANCHRLRTHKQMKTGVLTGRKATHEKVDIAPTLFDIAN
jgi:hypothetical protein